MKKLILLLCSLLSVNVLAKTPQEKGLEIAARAHLADSGWGDVYAEMTMTLRNRQGGTSDRAMRTKQLEVLDGGDKSLTVFDKPGDVKGTVFLNHTHVTTSDNQWLYLPRLKRIKRITSDNKSGPFMGSEFAYEDITSNELEKYTYTWLKDESVNGVNAHVIERIPAYEYSGYAKQITWVDQSMLQPIKIDFYDRKGALLKTLTYHKYEQYLEKYWRPGRMEMTNHINGKSTILNWDNYQFNNGYDAGDFDKNTMKRLR